MILMLVLVITNLGEWEYLQGRQLCQNIFVPLVNTVTFVRKEFAPRG